MLEDMGHTVLDAHSGRMALEMVAGNPDLDLVITDHAMPGMTGTELIRQLAARYPALPVVLATGYAELPNGEASTAPRLAKPLRQEELASVLDTLFAKSARAPARV
jgi:CheY-like chemotaxis protein